MESPPVLYDAFGGVERRSRTVVVWEGWGDMRKSLQVVGLAVALTGATQLFGLQVASADAAGHASCLGIEASAVSPPGSSDEAPAGMTDIVAFVQQSAADAGISPGAIFASVAHLHAGSHEACDEATG